MKKPLLLHLKASLLCALGAVVLALPLLWVPMLPEWGGWRPPVTSPRVEAVLAVLAAAWVAWCVVDIPRRGLKVLVWMASLWLLASGIWLGGLYGLSASSLVPVTAATLAGAGAMAFSFTPAGSRRAKWQSLVGPRVAPAFLRARIDEEHLDENPRTEVVTVAEVLWAGDTGDEHQSWMQLAERSGRAARHFQAAGAYIERCDAEGGRFVFGCWGIESPLAGVIGVLDAWVAREGGCAGLARGECVVGVGRLPVGDRWTLGGAPLRRAARMAASARGYAAGVLLDDDTAVALGDDWLTRRVAWWDFEGTRLLLREIKGRKEGAPETAAGDLHRYEQAWDAFWRGDWQVAGNGFAALAKDRDDPVARIFALRSEAARLADAAT